MKRSGRQLSQLRVGGSECRTGRVSWVCEGAGGWKSGRSDGQRVHRTETRREWRGRGEIIVAEMMRLSSQLVALQALSRHGRAADTRVCCGDATWQLSSIRWPFACCSSIPVCRPRSPSVSLDWIAVCVLIRACSFFARRCRIRQIDDPIGPTGEQIDRRTDRQRSG